MHVSYMLTNAPYRNYKLTVQVCIYNVGNFCDKAQEQLYIKFLCKFSAAQIFLWLA